MSRPIGARSRPFEARGTRAERGQQSVAPRRRAEQAHVADRAAVGERLEVGEVGVEMVAHDHGGVAVRRPPAGRRIPAAGWQRSRQCGKRAGSRSAGPVVADRHGEAERDGLPRQRHARPTPAPHSSRQRRRGQRNHEAPRRAPAPAANESEPRIAIGCGRLARGAHGVRARARARRRRRATTRSRPRRRRR